MATAPYARFVLPGIPRALERNKHRIVNTKSGGQFIASYLPAQSRSEQGAVKLFAQRAMEGRPPVEGPVEIRFTAFMPIAGSWSKKKQAAALAGELRPTPKPDLSNILKNLEDGMRQICYRDDSQIVAVHAWKFYSDAPRVVLEMYVVGSEAARPVSSAYRESQKEALSPLVGSL